MAARVGGIDTRCVLITGSGAAFSAGYDIGALPESSFERDAIKAAIVRGVHAANTRAKELGDELGDAGEHRCAGEVTLEVEEVGRDADGEGRELAGGAGGVVEQLEVEVVTHQRRSPRPMTSAMV